MANNLVFKEGEFVLNTGTLAVTPTALSLKDKFTLQNATTFPNSISMAFENERYVLSMDSGDNIPPDIIFSIFGR